MNSSIDGKGQDVPAFPEFRPYRTDLVYRFLSRDGRSGPVKTGLLYFAVSYVLLLGLGLLTGQFFGRHNAPPMYTGIVDHLNMGFLAPVGAALLCHLYGTIESCFQYAYSEQLLPKEEQHSYLLFIRRLDRFYNALLPVVLSIGLSIAFSSYNYLMKPTETTWLGVGAGLSGLYGRFFVTVNYSMVILIVYKCIVTVCGLHHFLATQKIRVQPMHPDRCGGLRPIGALAVAVNYFLAIVMVFISLLVFFDEFARTQPIYFILFLIFYGLAPFLLFFSLAKASRRMRETKQRSLKRLANTFDRYYSLLDRGDDVEVYDVAVAEEIGKVYPLYDIVEKMPVWPFDIRSVVRFFTTITLPAVLFIIQQLFDTGSVIHIAFRKLLGMQ